MKSLKRNFWIIWFTVTVLSFLLLFLGIKFILGSQMTAQNMIAYTLVSLIFGMATSTLYLLQLKIACVVSIAGLLIGFFEMYRAFLSDMNGWGDLAGLISLFTWMAIGLCAGAVSQLGWYLYKKVRSHKNKQ